MLAGAPGSPASDPHTPDRDDLVLLRLPPSAGRAAAVPRSPSLSPRAALESVRRQVADARLEGDPRLLVGARVLLEQAMASGSLPGAEAWVLKAEILQGLHAFAPALDAVGEALRVDPRHPGAWLLKAGIHQVRGELAPAREAALQLARFADPLIAVSVAASIRSLESPDPGPAQALAAALGRVPKPAPAIQAWAWSVLGEIQQRRNQVPEAEASFQESLRLVPDHPYTLAQVADLLLETGRPAGALTLVRDAPTEALRLRRAEAARRCQPEAPETRAWVQELGESFALAAGRGDDLHLREHARFRLRVLGDPAGALDLARRNWGIQKEPADLQLLVEAARAAGDTAGEAAARAWARSNQPATPLPGGSGQP